MAPSSEVAETDQRSLAASLAPSLVEACEHRLQSIRWFKADWQRGGAATGFAEFVQDDGSTHQVVVKMPIVRRELRWTRRLQTDDENLVVPKLFASGEELGGYDLAWVVIERLPYGPLGVRWHDDHIPRIAEAVARFAQQASAFPVDASPRVEDWGTMVDGAVENIRVNELPDAREWLDALKRLKPALDDLVGEWRARSCDEWQHGDVHLANAMSRIDGERGPVCLIDLAEVHAGHWVEDAIYLERQLWARPQRLKGSRPARAIAQARRRLGLPVEDDVPRLAMIRRGLLAATAPYFLKSEGSPAHLDACRQKLDIALGELT